MGDDKRRKERNAGDKRLLSGFPDPPHCVAVEVRVRYRGWRYAVRLSTFFLVFMASLVLDRTTKTIAVFVFRGSEGVGVPALFSFFLHKNTGLAFSFLSRVPAVALFLSVLSVLVLALSAVFFALRAGSSLSRVGIAGLASMLGGAAGNLADRLAYGYVVDWFYAGVFINAADVFLCLGGVLLAVDLFLPRPREAEES